VTAVAVLGEASSTEVLAARPPIRGPPVGELDLPLLGFSALPISLLPFLSDTYPCEERGGARAGPLYEALSADHRVAARLEGASNELSAGSAEAAGVTCHACLPRECRIAEACAPCTVWREEEHRAAAK
jgi:hypothetical protein